MIVNDISQWCTSWYNDAPAANAFASLRSHLHPTGKRSGDIRDGLTVQIRERFEEHDSIARRLVCEREPAMIERCCEGTRVIVVDRRGRHSSPALLSPLRFSFLFFPFPLLEIFLVYFLIKLEEVSKVQMLPNVETVSPRKLEAADFFFLSFVHRLPGVHEWNAKRRRRQIEYLGIPFLFPLFFHSIRIEQSHKSVWELGRGVKSRGCRWQLRWYSHTHTHTAYVSFSK